MLSALFILLGLVLAGLLLPVLIGLRAERQTPGAPVDLQVNWGFFAGLAGVQTRLHRESGWFLHPLILGWGMPFPRLRLGARRDAGEEEPPAAPAPQEAPTRTGTEGALKRVVALPRLAAQFARPGGRLLAGLGRSIRFRRLRLDGSFGLTDPASTGQLFGCLQGLQALRCGRLRLDLRPDFTVPGVRGRLRLAVHFYLGHALLLLALFAARLGWHLLAAKWASRKILPTRGDELCRPR